MAIFVLGAGAAGFLDFLGVTLGDYGGVSEAAVLTWPYVTVAAYVPGQHSCFCLCASSGTDRTSTGGGVEST